MIHLKSSALYLLSLSTVVEGHGYLKTPRSRPWVAREDGVPKPSDPNPQFKGKPEQDFCPHCLNTKKSDNLCGESDVTTLYDKWNDVNGDAMPWMSQSVYTEGDEITVEVVLSTNHAGHMDMYLCPDGNESTQDCMWANPATFVRDDGYGGPTDPDYPERAYFPNEGSDFKFTYKLPEGLTGENVLIQWRYITANSCFPIGYKNTVVGDKLMELGWLRASGMVDCVYPYDKTGAVGNGNPEQFWNCAEITINEKRPTPPTPAPLPTPPTTSAPTVPTKAPVVIPGYCNYGTNDPSRPTCDGQVEGGDWCNANESQCEGPCNGTWCLIEAPTPLTSTPTNVPTFTPSSRPTENPTVKPTLCIDVPTDKFFFKMRNDKVIKKPCKWLMKKSEEKRIRFCKKFTDSYGNFNPAREVCKVACDTCQSKSPTMIPNVTPTKSPTKPPVTSAPTTSGTSNPTRSPMSGDKCCSQFFDVCKPNPWCQESDENCTTCNGVFLYDLPKGPEICSPRYGMCSGDEDKCCFPSKCVKANDGTGQCMYYP